MRLRRFILASLAALVAFVSCENLENLGLPTIKLDGDGTMAFEIAGGDQQITLTATRDWWVEYDAAWLEVLPESGVASADAQTITVTAKTNPDMDRTADVKFSIGMSFQTLTVTQAGPGGSVQPGDGTKTNPYSAEKANEVASGLGADEKITGVYVQGVVSEIKELSTDYGNATYWITDEGGKTTFYVYRGRYLANAKFTSSDQLKVGDKVVVYGDLMNYMADSPQLGQGNYIVNLNGTEGEMAVPESKGKKTVEEFIAAADESNYYELTGTVSGFSSKYCSFDLTDESGKIYVFSVLDASKAEWSSKIANGGTITIYGKYLYYTEKSQHEVVDAWIVNYTPGEGGDEPEVPVEPGEFDPQGITWTLGANAYDKTSGQNAQYGKVNDVAVANLLKLGTGSKIGDAILHVPAGTEKIGFYAVAWKGKTAEVKFSINGTELTTIKPSANDGATQNPPYTITVTDDDYFVIEMPSADAADVKVETVDPENGRVIFIKLEANPDAEGGEEPEPPVVEETLMTVAEVLASTSALPEGSYIEAVVISDMTLNNLTSKKGLYVQDATGGLQFYLAANHSLNFGDKVKIDLSGVEVGEYNGAVQVSGVALEKITTISTDNAVEPKTVTVADFLANKYEGQYIAIEGVQVAESDLAKTFVEGTGDSAKHTSINVETADGKTFVIFSSKYASYGAETVPQGSGTIKGISSISKGTMQLIFAQESDYAGLTGERFGDNAGGEEPEPEPEPEVSTVAEVLKSTKGDAVSTKGTVMATHQRGYILGDATGAIYVYTNSAPTVAVGNNVTLSGTFDNYLGTLQIKDAVVSANDKSTTAPSYPTPVDLTDQAAYDAFKTYGDSSPVDFPYVKIKGVLSDGRYITVGTSEKQSMIDRTNNDYSSYNDKTVVVTAYIKGFHSTDGYYQIIESSEGGDEGGNEGGEGENPGGEVTPPAEGDDPAPSEGSWAKVTSLTDLTAGKYVVVFKHDDDGKYYAMTNASASKNPSGIEVTVEGAAISGNVDASVQWTFIGDNEAGFSISAGDNYLNSKDDSQGISISTTSTCKWYVTEDASNGYLLQRKDTEIARYLAAYRNSSGVVTFRYYNVGASYKGELMFFKQAE